MELTFLGGADGIGASCAVLDIDDTRLVIDCGQRMGASLGQALPDFSFLETGPPITAMLITHAHADHIGALPALESFLPPGCPIYATEPTLALVKVMLDDSVRIMIQHRQGDGELPLFPPAAVSKTIHRFQTVRWGKPIKLGESEAWGTWFPAGHILGAAMIEIHEGRESILFSGDVSVADQLSVPGVFVPAIRPNILVMESTYGNRLHAHRPAQEQRIVDRVADCIKDGGNVLFPTFALGRAQEVLLLLGRAMRKKTMPTIPVYADGLVRSISKVYRRFSEDLAPGCRKLWEQGLDPIFPEDLPILPIKNNEHREKVAAIGPCVVVASSGMLQGGASQFYAKQWINDQRNLIIVTGYQDEESPGQALLNLTELPADQPRYFKLGGVRTEVHCQVESCQLSAHADNGELVSLVSKLQPKTVFLVHGDATARAYLAKSLMAGGHTEVILSGNGETHLLLDESWSGQPRPTATVRTNPLTLWPPWDPLQPRPLDLERCHEWLASLTPRVAWITLDELAQLWKSPQEVTSDDLAELREAVYGHSQPYFLPDARRPYILRVNAAENVAQSTRAVRRLDVEQSSKAIHELFGDASGLKRFGFYPEEGTVQLEFQFPRAARRHYLRRLGELSERTGWETRLLEETHDADLRELIQQWLIDDPGGAIEVFHFPPRVRLKLDRGSLPSDASDFSERFLQKTGYALDLGIPAEELAQTGDEEDEPRTVVSDPAAS